MARVRLLPPVDRPVAFEMADVPLDHHPFSFPNTPASSVGAGGYVGAGATYVGIGAGAGAT